MGQIAVGRADVDCVRQTECAPQPRNPRSDGDHHLFHSDRAVAGDHALHGARRVELEAEDFDALDDVRTGRPRLVREPEHRLAVEREAARVLVQAYAQARRAPVVEQAAHVLGYLVLAHDQLRWVADALLALVDLHEVRLLARWPEGDVTRAVVVERLGIGLPDLHTGGHQLAHRGLEVVVADHAAGDAGRAGGHAGLVHHEHLLALGGQVPCGGQSVHARADHERANRARKWIGQASPPAVLPIRQQPLPYRQEEPTADRAGTQAGAAYRRDRG